MRTKILLPLVTIALVCAGCGGDEPSPSPSPLPAISNGPQPSGTGALPTTSPGEATGTVTSGNATIQLAGDLTGTLQLLILGPPAVYSPPPGAIALSWTDGQQSLALTGDSFTGEQPTSDTLSISLTARNGAEFIALGSSDGECSVTVTAATDASITGTFACTNLPGTTAAGGALSVDATGTFAASG
jgi:hypothetical protein